MTLPKVVRENRAKSVGGRRLLALASFLETKVPRKRFYFGRVVADDGHSRGCGSNGCAMGWAPSVPMLRMAGLRRNTAGMPVFKDTDYYISVATALFDISSEEAVFLFQPKEVGGVPGTLPTSATPKQVAAHIRDFVYYSGM